MEDVCKLLEGVFYIATAEDGQPHVRPFDSAAVVDGRLFIGTRSDKKVYQQIVRNPKVEIFAMGSRGMVRFSAEAFPIKDDELNRRAYEEMGKDPDDENIASLELKNIRGFIAPAGEEKRDVSF